MSNASPALTVDSLGSRTESEGSEHASVYIKVF